MTVSTIKPNGGGDYQDLATWEAALSTGSQTAECYRGNVGVVTLNDTDPSDITITVAEGDRHTGVIPDDLSQIAHSSGNGNSISVANVTIEYLYIITANQSLNISGAAASISNLIIRNNIFKTSSAIVQCIVIASNNYNGTSDGIQVYNNIFIKEEASNGATFQIAGNTTSAVTQVVTLAVYNNVVYGNVAVSSGGVFVVNTLQSVGSSTLNITARNNIVIDISVLNICYKSQVSSGTLNKTGSNNASTDNTANTFWSDSDAIVNFTPADEFVDVPDNFKLGGSSQFRNAGFDLSGTFTTDMLNNTRSVWDLGPLAKMGSPNLNPFVVEQIRRLRNVR